MVTVFSGEANRLNAYAVTDTGFVKQTVIERASLDPDGRDINGQPGDDYVDWLGLDGFNRGGANDGDWESLLDVFGESYGTLNSTKKASGGSTMLATIG